jgi:hypothetical protein
VTNHPTPEQIAAEEAEWFRTGRIPCHDCGTMVRTSNLETLPARGCTQRQLARRQLAEEQ